MSYYTIKDFKNLHVWQKSVELSKEIYKITEKFPQFEKFATTSQIIRSCNSIGANIAEGIGQLYLKKEISFFSIALGSTTETRHWIVIALQNDYITKDEFDALDSKLEEIKKMILGYVNKLKVPTSIDD